MSLAPQRLHSSTAKWAGAACHAIVQCVEFQGMSLAEIEEAVKELSPEELTKLAAYVTRQDKLGWDEQIEEDFSPGGKHAAMLQRLDAEIDAGNFTPLP